MGGGESRGWRRVREKEKEKEKRRREGRQIERKKDKET
jgi:hypothetical protein